MCNYNEVTKEEFERRLSSAMNRDSKIKLNCDVVQDFSLTLYWLAEDKLSGYSIQFDELGHVFSEVKGRGAGIMTDAINNGARELNCFEGYLTEFYAKHGFEEVDREANWTAGEPDVVFMELR